MKSGVDGVRPTSREIPFKRQRKSARARALSRKNSLKASGPVHSLVAKHIEL